MFPVGRLADFPAQSDISERLPEMEENAESKDTKLAWLKMTRFPSSNHEDDSNA